VFGALVVVGVVDASYVRYYVKYSTATLSIIITTAAAAGVLFV